MAETNEQYSDLRISTEDESSDPADTALQEGIDYYFEDGLMVFTSRFLQQRGYCCESGCRHCPYGYTTEQRDER